MEEKKFDKNSLIGFLIIGAILIWMLYMNSNEEAKQEVTTEQVADETTDVVETTETKEVTPTEINAASATDSLAVENLKNRLGSFAYSGTLPSATEGTTTIQNDVLELKVSNKGGHIVEAKLKEHTTYTGEQVYLIKDGNNDFNLQFTAENRLLNTRDLYFEPSVSKNGEIARIRRRNRYVAAYVLRLEVKRV